MRHRDFSRSARLFRLGTVIGILVTLLCAQACCEVIELPDDPSVGGMGPYSKYRVNSSLYLDPTITVSASSGTYSGTSYNILEVRVSCACQIRTVMSDSDLNSDVYSDAEDLAKSVNAIAAVNGDCFKLQPCGLLVRQGTMYRENYLDTQTRDILIIDSNGDFHCVRNATQELMDDYRIHLISKKLTIRHTFSAGPLLIVNGEKKELSRQQRTKFNADYPMQRSVIVQLGKLRYAIVVCDGRTDYSSGMTLDDISDLILSLYPSCQMAYNLDGGGGSYALFIGTQVRANRNKRKICDLLYFASAWEE